MDTRKTNTKKDPLDWEKQLWNKAHLRERHWDLFNKQ